MCRPAARAKLIAGVRRGHGAGVSPPSSSSLARRARRQLRLSFKVATRRRKFGAIAIDHAGAGASTVLNGVAKLATQNKVGRDRCNTMSTRGPVHAY